MNLIINPDAIARLITEDPDVPSAYGLAESLTGSNLQTASPSEAPDGAQALDLGMDDMDAEIDELDSSDEQEDALKTELEAQQEAEEAVRQQQQEVLKPQINDLNKHVQNLDQAAMRGIEQVQGGNETFGQLDQQMSDVRSLLHNLQRSI